MVQPVPRRVFGFADYLNWEHRQAIRHESVRGEILAMTGASDLHNELSSTFYAVSYTHLDVYKRQISGIDEKKARSAK